MATSPTDRQLAWLAHWIFVLIRQWAGQKESGPLIAELADLAELIPLQWIHRDNRCLEIIVEGCVELEARHPELGDSLTRVFQRTDEAILGSLWIRDDSGSPALMELADKGAV